MSRPIIQVENLSKRYLLGQFGARTMRQEVEQFFTRFRNNMNGSGDNHQSHNSEFWALKNVSFSVQPGEVVGIIGRNGAGKSTLLKVLSWVTEPTSGTAYIRGRVASLLEVGTGFHPDLTGRENVFLNGAILGMTKAEIKAKFDEVVDFSGVAKFIDTPVKRYSSGMYVRLAFAVAAHLEPEILIVDEVLAVGDTKFQQKCLGKMRDASNSGRTILFVSHNLAALQSLCSRALLLNQGRLLSTGSADVVVSEYHALDFDRARVREVGEIERPLGMQPVIIGGSLNGAGLKGTHKILPESLLEFSIEIVAQRLLPKCTFGIHFETDPGGVVYSINTRWMLKHVQFNEGKYQITAVIERVPLVPGSYFITIGVSSEGRQLDWLSRIAKIEIAEFDVFGTGELPWSGQGYVISRPIWNIRRLEA